MGLFLLLSLLFGFEPSRGDPPPCVMTQTTPTYPKGNARITELGNIEFEVNCDVGAWKATIYDDLWGEHGSSTGTGSPISITPSSSGYWRLGVSTDIGAFGTELQVGTKPLGTPKFTTTSCTYDTYYKTYSGIVKASGVTNIEGHDPYYTYELVNPNDSESFHIGPDGLTDNAMFNATAPGEYSVKVFGWAGPWSIPVPPGISTAKAIIGDDKCVPFFPGTIEHKIFQVVENPQLDPPPPGEQWDNVVDLVAGKNADVMVAMRDDFNHALLKNYDIRGSKIELAGEFFSAISDTTSASGDATFHIDTVPDVEGKFDLKIKMMTEQNLPLVEDIVKVHIRKTKPIKLGVVPMSGCGAKDRCYSGATYEGAVSEAYAGSTLIKGMYPVSDANISFSDVTFPIPISTEDTGEDGLIEDLASLSRMVEKKVFAHKDVNYAVGVATESYFKDHLKGEWGDKVGAAAGGDNALLVIEGDPQGVPHELGHTFFLHHSDSSVPSGFLNYDLFFGAQSWYRGPLYGAINMMGTQAPVGEFINYWPSRDDYLKIFSAHLQPQQDQPPGLNLLLRISAFFDDILREDNSPQLKILNTYYSKTPMGNSGSNGKYVVEVKGISRNIIHSIRTDAMGSDHLNLEYLNFTVAAPINAAVIDLYREETMGRAGAGTIVVPVDTLADELKYLPEQAFSGDAASQRSQLQNIINRMRIKVLEKNALGAKEILVGEFLPGLDDVVKDEFSKSSIMDSDKYSLRQASVTSYIRLRHLEGGEVNRHPFVELSLKGEGLSGQSSTLKIKPVRSPELADQVLIYRAFIDGEEVNVKKRLATSPLLHEGDHVWSVQVYIADNRLESDFQAALNLYNRKREEARLEYEIEVDPDSRLRILKLISEFDQKISNILNQRERSRRAIAVPAELQFKVL